MTIHGWYINRRGDACNNYFSIKRIQYQCSINNSRDMIYAVKRR